MATTKSEVFAELKKKYPTVSKISISYEGSGDSFGDFYHIVADDQDGNDMEISHGEIQNIVEDYCFEIFDKSGQPNFNDDGSTGTITLDIDNNITILDNYWYVRTEEHTGTEYY